MRKLRVSVLQLDSIEQQLSYHGCWCLNLGGEAIVPDTYVGYAAYDIVGLCEPYEQ